MDQIKSQKKLLWTGGWDSTYRLCEIAIVLKKSVQPFYLIDEGRKSLREELKAQSIIKAAIFKKFPYTKELILPTYFSPVSDLKKNITIENHYLKLKREIGFGSQYEWLANFCHTNSINDLELGFEKDAENKKYIYLSSFITNKPDSDTYILSPEFKEDSGFEIFKYFEWPLLDVSRKDMVTNSLKFDFDDIMHLTWFCHNPINGKACGLCNPCKDAIKDGFGYRVGGIGLFRNRYPVLSKEGLKRIINKLKRIISAKK